MCTGKPAPLNMRSHRKTCVITHCTHLHTNSMHIVHAATGIINIIDRNLTYLFSETSHPHPNTYTHYSPYSLFSIHKDVTEDLSGSLPSSCTWREKTKLALCFKPLRIKSPFLSVFLSVFVLSNSKYQP